MKPLLILCLLAGSARAGVTSLPVQAEALKSTLLISAPALEKGDKYGEVSISVNTSRLVSIPIASNKWLIRVPYGTTDGTFEAIVCGRGRCMPVKSSWVVQGETDYLPTTYDWVLLSSGLGCWAACFCITLYLTIQAYRRMKR